MKKAEIYRKTNGQVIITCQNLSWSQVQKCADQFHVNNYYKMFFEFDNNGNLKTTFQKYPINQTLTD